MGSRKKVAGDGAEEANGDGSRGVWGSARKCDFYVKSERNPFGFKQGKL